MSPTSSANSGSKSWLLRLGLTAAAVAAVTALIYPLGTAVPVLALGVLYLVAVLIPTLMWGWRYGAAAALLAALCFNYFHLPPAGRLSIHSTQDAYSLLVFSVVAGVAVALAELGRRREVEAQRRSREATVTAGLAQAMLASESSSAARAVVAHRLTAAFGLDSARVTEGVVVAPARQQALPLMSDGQRAGTLLLSDSVDAQTALSLRRIAPALAALLLALERRDALESELVEAAALRKSDAMKTALLRSFSHDLRSPLTAITAAGQTLRSGGHDQAQQRELAESIVQEAQRLALLMDKLLDLSRLEAGSAAPRADWCSLPEVVEAAVVSSGSSIATLKIELPQDLPLVRADSAQLERAVGNLLENANRHAQGSAVEVHAGVSQGLVWLEVQDHGPGIDPRQVEAVFKPFTRGERAQPGGGSGLGLAIARGFVELNGGRVTAKNLADDGGSGASFTIELPVADAVSNPELAVPEESA